MKEPQESISDQLALTVAETGSLDLPAELLEFSIDQTLDDGLLKDVPFVGWIAKGIALKSSISDRILHHKILRFLTALESQPSGKKSRFRQRVLDDSEFRKRVGEHLLLILDRVDIPQKAEIIAKCFDHFLTGDIDHACFIDLSEIVDRSSLRDLRTLTAPSSERFAFSPSAAAAGICNYRLFDSDVEELPVVGWTLSRYGKDLKDIILGEFRQRVEDEQLAGRKSKEQHIKRKEREMREAGLDTSAPEYLKRKKDYLQGP